MSVFLNTFYWLGVVGLSTLGLDQQGGLSALGMSIFVNTFILVRCTRALYTWASLGGPSTLGVV